jgi:hypothetical protein
MNGISVLVISIEGLFALSTNHSLIPNEEGKRKINLLVLFGS